MKQTRTLAQIRFNRLPSRDVFDRSTQQARSTLRVQLEPSSHMRPPRLRFGLADESSLSVQHLARMQREFPEEIAQHRNIVGVRQFVPHCDGSLGIS